MPRCSKNFRRERAAIAKGSRESLDEAESLRHLNFVMKNGSIAHTPWPASEAIIAGLDRGKGWNAVCFRKRKKISRDIPAGNESMLSPTFASSSAA